MSKKPDLYIFRIEGTSHLKEDLHNMGLKIHPEEHFFKSKLSLLHRNFLKPPAVSKKGIRLP